MEKTSMFARRLFLKSTLGGVLAAALPSNTTRPIVEIVDDPAPLEPRAWTDDDRAYWWAKIEKHRDSIFEMAEEKGLRPFWGSAASNDDDGSFDFHCDGLSYLVCPSYAGGWSFTVLRGIDEGDVALMLSMLKMVMMNAPDRSGGVR
jgi:hypothetical protein